jgi:nitrate/nitrite transport system ATP-binding protein
MSFLQLQNVAKSFQSAGPKLPVLHDVTLEVAREEFVAIVGFSGSGKSTLMSLLAGLIAPDSGQVSFDGAPVTGPGPQRGIVFQNYSLAPLVNRVWQYRAGRRSSSE